MKKQLLIVAALACLVLGMIGTAHATVLDSYDDSVKIDMPYETVSMQNADFEIDGSGLATMEFKVKPYPSGYSGYTVKASVKITRAGSTILNTTYTLNWQKSMKEYRATKTKQLSSTGAYTLQTTYKIYEGNTLIETIPCNPVYASY